MIFLTLSEVDEPLPEFPLTFFTMTIFFWVLKFLFLPFQNEVQELKPRPRPFFSPKPWEKARDRFLVFKVSLTNFMYGHINAMARTMRPTQKIHINPIPKPPIIFIPSNFKSSSIP
ncbi:MAG: hypothetical protein JW755_04555, partial [Candidatus Aminicenantes bacterium]|nr:hypothetical protein [Candidatus Aminicenantes bacterium]